MKWFKTLVTVLVGGLIWIGSSKVQAVTEKDAEKLNVLIVDGFSNHDWKTTTAAISTLLEQEEGIEVSVATVPAVGDEDWEKWLPQFADYAVVIQNTNDISGKGAWPKGAQLGLERYVAEGGGLLVLHSANNAFVDWKAYNEMIGLGWRKKDFGEALVIENGKVVRVPAGQGEGTGHGKRRDALVTRLGDHPIHAGLPHQWRAADTEVYRYARGPAQGVTVLSYAKDEKTGLNFPTEWVVNYGKGRVYSSTFGHCWHGQKELSRGMRCRGFETLTCRAVRWLGRAEVSDQLPEEFPTADKASVRPLAD